VILDEAYCEFNQLDAPESSIGLLERHSNLVLLRTFSKVHGLGGLRVGFALCGSTELPQALNQVRQPFFCSVVAQAAAIEALNHQDVISERVAKTIEVRVDMIEGLRKLGLDPADSQANFCWVELGDDHDEQQVMKGLMERGVLVHAGATLGKKGALRISCGTPEENSHFLTALAEVL
jgi:histidinol-phosphate aminotransferase